MSLYLLLCQASVICLYMFMTGARLGLFYLYKAYNVYKRCLGLYVFLSTAPNVYCRTRGLSSSSFISQNVVKPVNVGYYVRKLLSWDLLIILFIFSSSRTSRRFKIHAVSGWNKREKVSKPKICVI